MYPSYLQLKKNKELEKRITKAESLLSACRLCPRQCGINRLKDKSGFCKTANKARLYNHMLHRGEEPPISGARGSGTIFFSGCNMACVYCQNYKFSQLNQGKEIECQQLAEIMLGLQESGCHNINLVTPTHVMPQILRAISTAIDLGLRLPLVYNTSGYELPEAIQLLEGIVDIYLADMRYASNEMAEKYSNAVDYPKYNQAAIKNMHRQVGIAKFDNQGIMVRGLLIRHLVLPHNIAETEKIMQFISRQISDQTYISLMSQYLPCYKAGQFQELSRRITDQEYQTARELLLKFNLHNGWVQVARGNQELAGINIQSKKS